MLLRYNKRLDTTASLSELSTDIIEPCHQTSFTTPLPNILGAASMPYVAPSFFSYIIFAQVLIQLRPLAELMNAKVGVQTVAKPPVPSLGTSPKTTNLILLLPLNDTSTKVAKKKLGTLASVTLTRKDRLAWQNISQIGRGSGRSSPRSRTRKVELRLTVFITSCSCYLHLS